MSIRTEFDVINVMGIVNNVELFDLKEIHHRME